MRHLLSVLISCAFTAGMIHAQTPAGVIKTVTGEVQLVRGGQTMKALEGMTMQVGDSVRSLDKAGVGLAFLDGTRVALAEKSEMKIEKFIFDPAQGKLGLSLDLVKGVFIYMSGKIAKLAPKSVEIKTPVGVAGTRGTDLAIRLGDDAP